MSAIPFRPKPECGSCSRDVRPESAGFPDWCRQFTLLRHPECGHSPVFLNVYPVSADAIRHHSLIAFLPNGILARKPSQEKWGDRDDAITPFSWSPGPHLSPALQTGRRPVLSSKAGCGGSGSDSPSKESLFWRGSAAQYFDRRGRP